MAKKKTKASTNPTRGFATTSVASKPKIKEAEPTSTAPSVSASKDANNGGKSPDAQIPAKGPGHASNDVATLHQLSPDQLEQQLEENELQLLVDEYSAKVKRDCQRQITRLQTDCRLLRSQAQPLFIRDWLTAQNVEEILQLANDDLQHLPAAARELQSFRPSEDEQLVKLWGLEQTLSGLGFSEAQVKATLENAVMQKANDNANNIAFDVSECFDYLALHLDEVDLPSFDQQRVNGTATPTAPETTSESSSTLQAATPTEPLSRSSSPASAQIAVTDVGSTALHDSDLSISDLDSDLDPDEMTQKYVMLKTRLYSLEPNIPDQPRSKKRKDICRRDPHSPATNSGLAAKLATQIEKLKGDILFDARQAEQLWEVKRIELAQEAAVRRKLDLRADTSSDVRSPPEHAYSGVRAKDRENADVASDQEDGDDGEIMGDLFLEPSAPPTTSEAVNDSTVTLRDFGKSAGLSPRRILEDACKSRDSGVRLTYQQVSPSTWSCRHSVTIVWTKPQVIDLALADIDILHFRRSTTFTMRSIAATDTQQSEYYISVAALFVIFSASPKDEKVSLRLAPTWRDVWQEFASTQKAKQDVADRADLKRLRNLLRHRQELEEERGIVLAQRSRVQDNGSHQPDNLQLSNAPGMNEQLQALWQSKTISSAYQSMQPTRRTLPIFAFKDQILATISSHQVVILCGETGCGKSTQLPAYVLERELSMGHACKIYCTEPRRISAISLAERVSAELGEPKGAVGTPSSLIGYSIRLESQVASTTRLIYATVGIVLRMLESRDGLAEITHLIIDEVHERSIDTDFLLIIVKALLLQRPHLKVVLMSATVDAERFAAYFGGIPILTVPGRTFPVQTMFLEDAVELTHIANDSTAKVQKDDSDDSAPEDDMKENQRAYRDSLQKYTAATRHLLMTDYDEYRIDYNLITRLIVEVAFNPSYSMYSNAFLVFLPGIAEIRELNDILRNHPKINHDWLIYPLHSTIASEEQQQAFLVPPPGVRKVVLATNIAETGITIPDITCVIDTGKHKEMRFDERRQLSRLLQAFISRSNAKQRRGRAGRVQEGLCFHLFSKYRHDNILADSQTPEMLRLSLQDLVMRVKICKLGNIEDTLSEALDPPAQKNIRKAIDALVEVGALTSGESLTALGQQIAKLPLDAVLGKLCLLASIFGCLDVALTIAAILSSKSPFVTPFGQRQQADSVRLGFKRGDSDLLTLYNAYTAWRKICSTPGQSEHAWCRKNFLSPQTLGGIEDLKAQLMNSLIDAGFVQLSNEERATLNRYRYASRIRHFVPVPASLNSHIGNDEFLGSIIAYAFYPKVLVRDGKGWRNVSNNQSVSLHPTSVNKGIQSAKLLSYYSIMQTSSRFLNAQYTNVALELPLVLFAGSADFRMFAGVVVVDGNRLRYSVKEWKMLLAVKTLRQKLKDIVTSKLRSPSKPIGKRLERWMEVLYNIFDARVA